MNKFRSFLRNAYKIIFSRMISIGLSVIIQVLLIVLVLLYLQESYVYFQIASSLIGLLVFIAIVNEDTHPEFKIVWALLFVLLPLIGIVLYIMFKLNGRPKKYYLKYHNFNKELVSKNKESENKIKKITKDYYDQFEYLENMTEFSCYRNTNVTFLDSGEKFYESLLSDLENANKFIFIETFILSKCVMWERILDILKAKASDGVEVRVLYDDFGSAKYCPFNYHKKLRKLGIKCYKFNTVYPVVTSYHNNRDHRKIVIIDGVISYTGGLNLSDEYVNITHPFGHWLDFGVRLYGEATNTFTILFLQNYGLSSKKYQNYDEYIVNDSGVISDEVVFPFGTGPRKEYYANIATDVFLNIINSAKETIDITSPYLAIDYSLKNALINAKARGVKVRILIPTIPDKKIVYQFTKLSSYELSKYGIDIYKYSKGFNHAKGIVADGKIAYLGTTNFDFRSLFHHYECGCVIYNSDAITDFENKLEEVFNISNYQTTKDLKQNVLVRIFISFLKTFESLI